MLLHKVFPPRVRRPSETGQRDSFKTLTPVSEPAVPAGRSPVHGNGRSTGKGLTCPVKIKGLLAPKRAAKFRRSGFGGPAVADGCVSRRRGRPEAGG